MIDRAAVVPTFLTLASANTVVNLASHPTAGRPAREGEVERITWLTAKMGENISAPDYVRATQTAHRLGRQMAAFHSEWDVLLTPGLSSPAAEARLARHDDGRRERVLAPRVRVLAVHGLVQPHRPARTHAAARPERGGLPLAVQLVGRFGDEATLIRLGAQLEAARPWFGRKPAVSVM